MPIIQKSRQIPPQTATLKVEWWLPAAIIRNVKL